MLGAQTDTITRKNSGARNLHRLVSAVSFIANLLQNVVKDPSATLRQARHRPDHPAPPLAPLPALPAPVIVSLLRRLV